MRGPAAGNCRSILEHFGTVPFLGLPLGIKRDLAYHWVQRAGGIRLKMGSEDALAVSWRRASKQGWLPVSDGRAIFKKHWRGISDPEQDDRDQHDHERH